MIYHALHLSFISITSCFSSCSSLIKHTGHKRVIYKLIKKILPFSFTQKKLIGTFGCLEHLISKEIKRLIPSFLCSKFAFFSC